MNGSVLVTGAAGFVGTWLCRALLEREARVVALVRGEDGASPFADVAPRLIVVRGDLGDLPLLLRILARYEVGIVFHLGAETLVGPARRDPAGVFESNIRGTWNLLEACRRNGRVEAVVTASSDKAYGFHGEAPYTEETPLEGLFPYDVSKACADRLAACYHATYGLPVAVTRCGNLYGGGDLHWSRLVPGTVRSALRGERPVIRSDGKRVRDYLYVEDAVDGYLRLAASLREDPSLAGEAFNLSGEAPMTVLEVARRVLKAAGRSDLEPRVLDLPEARYEIPAQRLCARKAREQLGWRPNTGIEEGLRRTVEWYRAWLRA